MSTVTRKIVPADVKILRDLATRIRQIANDPVNPERKQAWYALGDLAARRPMILAETGGVPEEVVPAATCRCTEEWARNLEYSFRHTLYRFEHVNDDAVVEPYLSCNWKVDQSDYGVQTPRQYADNAGKLGSYHWDPPIKDLDRDFGRLKPRTFSVDREHTLQWKAHLENILGDIMPVRLRGSFWWTMGMTIRIIDLIGLEGLMLAMYDNPQGLHRIMAFLRDDHLAFVDWTEKEGLLTLNNENDYIGSGSTGYTRHLPQPDYKPGRPVRARDLWVLSESQETVGVSPELFEEFVFQYQLPVIRRFGLCYYGCCEPVHSRWHVLKKIPNLQRVSVSPWCNEAFMAENLARNYVFSRKPNPTLISCERFDEDLIRQDLRRTLAVAKDYNLEIVMKDVHTLCGRPERLGRWVQLARETCREALS
jgi:hypothetical protein